MMMRMRMRRMMEPLMKSGSPLPLAMRPKTPSANLVCNMPPKFALLDHDAKAVNYAIHRWVDRQIFYAAQTSTDQTFRDRLYTIAGSLHGYLIGISRLIDSDRIRPFRHIALSESERPPHSDERVLRIGFYPISANPLHWGHILVGLNVMASMSLDKIIYIIAGEDNRKPSMISAHSRHKLGRSVLEQFYPLFEYSSLAIDTGLDGETNFGRLLGLNLGQPMKAFYIAGSDHYRRVTEQGEPDTIQKLEQIVKEQGKTGSGLHTISAIFLDRESERMRREDVATSLIVEVLPAIPLRISSSIVRQALREQAFAEALGSLPYSSLLEIRAAGLYRA